MRKLLTNPKIKALFLHILFCTLSFETGMIVLLSLRSAPAAYLLCLPVLMGAVTAFFCYRFFREQEQIIEDAAEKVREYISGNREARIECSEEGEWYRLFHEVNALAAILNAKAENEGRARGAEKYDIRHFTSAKDAACRTQYLQWHYTDRSGTKRAVGSAGIFRAVRAGA